MLLHVLLIQFKISLYLGPVGPVRCFVTPDEELEPNFSCPFRIRFLPAFRRIRDVPNFGSGSGRSDIRPFMANPAPAILLAGFGQVPDNNIRAVPCCKQSIIVFPVYV